MNLRASKLAAWVLLIAGSSIAADLPPYVLFETGQVRPLALSADNTLLFATNTPDNRLEIFSTARGTLSSITSVPVGLEPIAVAVRSATQVWVVNHLSDSVSIVDVSGDLSAARVVRTLLVGDEPRDIVFAGPDGSRAFITTAHRGQRLADLGRDPQLTTDSIGRADVWVFDADNLGDAAGGTPSAIVTLFSDTPRALASSPDGGTVYAAAFNSGNQTTVIGAGAIDSRGLPPPHDNIDGVLAPREGLIVKFRRSSLDGQMHWMDEREDVTWDDQLRFRLPDKDVFAIDANANPPGQVNGDAGNFTGVGTVLFNLAVNPVSGKIYVSNTDANNATRFEGTGMHAPRQTVRGELAKSRITVLSPGQVSARHLNKHIDYTQCCAMLPNDENQKSLAFPQGMAVTGDGQTLYVAAFGSSKVGIFSTAALEDDSFQPDIANQITVSGGGPTGLALNEAGQRLYVLTRFNNSISVIDTAAAPPSELSQVALSTNPEPANVINGRRFLYDATLSSHGDSACASCHIFGDFDGLAWDLGNPDGQVVPNPNPFEVGTPQPFHPMKGPMTTQSLRGMDNHGPMHWRGDRTGAYDAPSIQPNGGAYDEDSGFKKFQPAFLSLLGRNDSQPLPDDDMQAFSDFVLQIMYPPNPIRNLDNSLTLQQQQGRDIYFGAISDIVRNCNGCHTLDPHGNEGQAGVLRPGFFGTEGKSSEENEPQQFKVPHLRNAYQKVGMFGMAPQPDFFPEQAGGIPFMGDQIRGFGMLHDGSVDTLFRFHGAGVFQFNLLFNPGGFLPGEPGYPARRAVEAFILAFDSNLAPIVGQQMTLGPDNFADPTANARIDLLEERADVSECQVVVKGLVKGQAAAFLYQGGGTFVRRPTGDILSEAAVRALANQPGGELTFTCVPPGSGIRIADEL